MKARLVWCWLVLSPLLLLLSTSCFFLVWFPGVAEEVRPLACSHHVRAALLGARRSTVMPSCVEGKTLVSARKTLFVLVNEFLFILRQHAQYHSIFIMGCREICAVIQRFATVSNEFPNGCMVFFWSSWQYSTWKLPPSFRLVWVIYITEISQLSLHFSFYIISSSYWFIFSDLKFFAASVPDFPWEINNSSYFTPLLT